MLWMRFVTRKKSGVALDHDPARVQPGAAGVGEQRRSISATPPPRAVELTFQITREPSSACPREIVVSNSSACSGCNTDIMRSGATGDIGTSCRLN